MTAAVKPHVITTRSVVSWVLYDLANTIFSMSIVSLYFSLYIRDVVGPETADRVYGFTTAVSMGIIFALSPLLGAFTDRAPRRVPFLIVSTLICVGFTALLGQGGLGPSLVFFVIANAAYQAGLQFYDALLADVSTEENRGVVGGIGVGFGYFGSFVGIGTGLVMLEVLKTGKTALFQVTALLFLLFAWPAFLWIGERGNPRAERFTWGSLRQALDQVMGTLRQSHRYPGLFRFLVGRVFYTDAVNTVISIMGLYVTNLATQSGLPPEEGERVAQVMLLVAVTFAVAGGFIWGKVVDRVGPKKTLDVVLLLWALVFLAAALAGLLALPLWLFYWITSGAGLAMGGTWAADRPYMLRLSPPSRIGEFYGLYGMVGRFSAITGPLLWGLVVGVFFEGRPEIGQPVGLLTLLLMIVAGYWILRPVSDAKREWAGDDLA